MHAFLDKYTVAMTAAIVRSRKWFGESVESPGFAEQMENIKLSLPEFAGEGFYELKAETMEGLLDPAFHLARWLGPDYPTVIYHHGNNERPFNYGAASKNTFKAIFLSQKNMFQANLISLRAPFHNQSIKGYLDKLARLSNFTALLAVSVKLIEALVRHFKSSGGRVMVAGLSLGGWATNLHRSFYNSADIYVPVFAGAALDELFTRSCYRKLAGEPVAEKPDSVRNVLNFESDFAKIKEANVFPLLARFDQFIEYERQKLCYGDGPVKVINKGHVTGTLASREIRNHILTHLNS